MGQCYEFGVTIESGCDHAMTVSAEGGACVCPTCNARCEGRFAGCQGILEQPGYVPVTAPQWAVERMARPVAQHAEVARGVVVEAQAPPAPLTADLHAQLRLELDQAGHELRAVLLDALSETEGRLRQSMAAEIVRASERSAVQQVHSSGETYDPLLANLAVELHKEHRALREEIVSQFDAVRRGVAGSQKEVGEFYERLVDAYDRLVSSQQMSCAGMQKIVEGFDRLLRRVEAIEELLYE